MTRAVVARIVLAAASAVCALGAVLALITLTAPPAPAGVPAAAPRGVSLPVSEERATVVRVVDAVTFDARLADGEQVRVRALGVDAPGACYADSAVQFARQVLDGKVVDLVTDGPARRTDRFDRRLAHAVLERGDYAVLAAEAGIARSYPTGTSPERVAPVREAQERARTAARGLWAPPCRGSSA